MPTSAAEVVAALSAAFTDRGPSQPQVTFAVAGDQVLVRISRSPRGQPAEVTEQAMPVPAVEVRPNRLKAFAQGTVMAARQLANAADELTPDDVYCPELLSAPALVMADAFRRAILDEDGLRATIRAEIEATESARRFGLSLPDAAGQMQLYVLSDPHSDREFHEQCDALKGLVPGRPDLAPHVAQIASTWVEDLDAWWPVDPETDTSGPRLLLGLLAQLTPGLPGPARTPILKALERVTSLPQRAELVSLALLD